MLIVKAKHSSSLSAQRGRSPFDLFQEMDDAESLRKLKKNGTFAFDPKAMVDKNGVPLYFTKQNATQIGGSFEARKIDTFETLQKMYTKEQVGFI